mmetsp:Transcript_33121/g.80016  ORF Transcript_33121/g.80016 Transcript_33121/m.80016 type:complete len:105 (+) Transcript_33121:1002-1316(+)
MNQRHLLVPSWYRHRNFCRASIHLQRLLFLLVSSLLSFSAFVSSSSFSFLSFGKKLSNPVPFLGTLNQIESLKDSSRREESAFIAGTSLPNNDDDDDDDDEDDK